MAVLNSSSPVISLRKGRYRESKNPFLNALKVPVKHIDSPEFNPELLGKTDSVFSLGETIKTKKLRKKRITSDKDSQRISLKRTDNKKDDIDSEFDFDRIEKIDDSYNNL